MISKNQIKQYKDDDQILQMSLVNLKIKKIQHEQDKLIYLFEKNDKEQLNVSTQRNIKTNLSTKERIQRTQFLNTQVDKMVPEHNITDINAKEDSSLMSIIIENFNQMLIPGRLLNNYSINNFNNFYNIKFNYITIALETIFLIFSNLQTFYIKKCKIIKERNKSTDIINNYTDSTTPHQNSKRLTITKRHTICWSSKKLKSLSEEFVTDPKAIKHLDISDNLIKTGRSLERFSNLQTLIMDENPVSSLQEFPSLSKLEHLSLIKNQITEIEEFIQLCKQKFPKLSNLNLMKNPVCPPFFIQEEEYHYYRQNIIKNIPTLTVLDGFPVSEKDLKPFVSEIQKSPSENQNSGFGKAVVRQQYIENEQARGVIEHNPKYGKVNANRNILKGTSQGNKHIPNDKL